MHHMALGHQVTVTEAGTDTAFRRGFTNGEQDGGFDNTII